MNWTTHAELRAQVQKLWDKGELLAGLIEGNAGFPKRLALKGPSSGEIADHFEAVHHWIADLSALPHGRIEMREFHHRLFGKNTLPVAVWLDTADAALAWLGKRRDAARFATLLAQTRAQQPQLLTWIAKRPLRALELDAAWQRLLHIVAWLQDHPRPGVYLRQVDIPGVDSKFIETHRGVLAEWLDLSLPVSAIDASASGVGQFAARYGFRDKPLRVRFRLLDPQASILPGGGLQDIGIDADSFARLDLKLARVIVVENEINYLSLPQLTNSMAIFGAGYGFDMLAPAAWLARCTIDYWGDIDTHGFAILDQLRSRYAQVQSFLMDRATLMQFAAHWSVEERPSLRDLPRLTPEESALYDDLRDNRLGNRVRLEQERIGYPWLLSALAQR